MSQIPGNRASGTPITGTLSDGNGTEDAVRLRRRHGLVETGLGARMGRLVPAFLLVLLLVIGGAQARPGGGNGQDGGPGNNPGHGSGGPPALSRGGGHGGGHGHG